MKLINCLLLLIVISTMVGVVQAQELQYETVTKMAENSDCAACHNQEIHGIHERTSATCQQCHGVALTDKQPECNKCHSGTIHNAPTKTVETPYEVLGAINATGTTFKTTSIDNPAVLYYDLEDRDGYSSITFPLYDNLSIPNGKLNYTTIPWGDYIGWGASKYAVVYSSSSEWIITKKLVDEDHNDDHILRVGETLALPNGWSITVIEIDADGTMAGILISKNGEEIDSKVVMEGGYLIYETDLGGPQESEVMNFTVETVFAGMNSNIVKINNIDLISIDTLEIKNNSTNLYDGYVIKTSTNQISILNDIDIWLSRGDGNNIISDLFLVQVNEARDMAGLVKKITESGIHEIVGATNASTGTMLMAMSADNPAVLYYDLEDKVGYESIKLPLNSNLSVPVGEMNYTTIPWEQNIAWGSSKYVVVNRSSSNWIITKKLVDEDQDDDHILRVGDTLVLQGGWNITTIEIDVDGSEATISISKDGEEVDNEVVMEGGYFVYETDLGGSQESEVMNFTVETVFAGMNVNLIKFNNLDLISTNVLDLNNNDVTLYDGYIIKTYPDQLTVLNDVDIELSKGKVTNVIGNLFAVKVNEAGNLGALVKEVEVDKYVSAIKNILEDGVIIEGDGYQINNYFVEVSDIMLFTGDLMLEVTIYQLNSDGSYDELTTSTIVCDNKRRVIYENGLIEIFVQEKNLTSEYAIVDIISSGFTVEYEKYVSGGVSNAVQPTAEATPTVTPTPTETVESQEYLIRIDNYMFIPVGDLSINVGDTIKWRNFEDSKQARVLINENGIWAEEQHLEYMNSVSYTFNQPGMYTFYLKGREEKKLNITVVSVPIPRPAPRLTQYEVLGAINATGTTFKATSIDNPAVLYYDLEDRDGYSSITFPLYDNSIPSGKLNYTTIPWGDYIGWGGSKYAVVYSSSSEWIITKKLVDEDHNDDHILRVGDTLNLPDGRSITVIEVDVDGSEAWMSISKNGEEVYSKVVMEGGYLIYETDLGGPQESEVMNFTVETVFAGMNSNIVKINNIDLISIDTLEIKNNSTILYDGYVIKTSTNQISILNDIDIWLSRGDGNNIISDLFLVQVNEARDMVGLVKKITESGIYEIVGATNASTGTMLMAMSADNPAVLYYDLEDKVGYESIRLPLYSNLSVPVGELNYTTIPWEQNIAWGSSKYVVVNSSSSNWIITKILIDEDQDDDHILKVGDTLVLQGGWSITVLKIDVDGSEATISISKDGVEVDSEVVTGGGNFVYETDLGGPQESEVMNFTVETVFAGMNGNLIKFNNLDLISTDVLNLNNNDATLYDGYIIKTYPDQLTVLNDVDIELSKGNVIDIIGNLFAVKVNEAGNLGALVKEVEVDEYVSAIKNILKDGVIIEGDGYQINNYFVEVSDIMLFTGDLMLEVTIYQLNSDGSYDELTTSTIVCDNKRRVIYENGLVEIFVQEKNLTSEYAIVDIISSGFTVEYEKYVTGGVSNAQYYTPEQSPYSYTMTLLQGWNLVSTPIIPDDPDVDTIFGSNEDVLPPVYTWSTTDKKFNEVGEIELGKGYWVLALNDTDVTFSGIPYSG